MKITLEFNDGASVGEMASRLRMQANILEGMNTKEAASVKNTTAKKVETAESFDHDESEDKEDMSFDSEVETEMKDSAFGENEVDFEAEDDEEIVPAPKKKPGRKAKAAKKLSLDDVNDACKKHARAYGRETTLKLLKKKFNTSSVTALSEDQYAACIEAMTVDM